MQNLSVSSLITGIKLQSKSVILFSDSAATSTIRNLSKSIKKGGRFLHQSFERVAADDLTSHSFYSDYF